MRVLACTGLALGQLMWAGNNVIARATVGEIPPFALAFWRWLIAFLVLLPFSARLLRRDWPAIRAQGSRLLVLGLCSIASFNTLLYLAAQTTTALNLTLIGQTLPMWALLFAWPILRHRPTLRQIYAFAVCSVGLAVIVTHGMLQVLLSLTFNRGDLIMLIAAFTWGLYSVLLKFYAPAIHPLSLLTCLVAVSLPVLAPLYLLEHRVAGGFALTPSILLTLGYVGLFASIFAMLLWNHGVRVMGPYTAAMFGYLHPLYTVILALPLLGESLHGYHVIGGLLIAGGVYLALTPPVPRRSRRRAREGG